MNQAASEAQWETLPNGLTLGVVVRQSAPSVALRGSYLAGGRLDGPDDLGVSGLTAAALRRGTVRRSAAELSELTDDLCATFGFWAGVLSGGLSARCLGRDLDAVVPLLQEMFEEPAFAPAEVTKLLRQSETHLKEEADSPRSRADELLRGHYYDPSHPYAVTVDGLLAALPGLTCERLAEFHAAQYGANGMTIVAVGDFNPERLRDLLSQWKPGPTPAVRDPLPGPRASGPNPELLRVDMPHKSQNSLLMALPGPTRLDPDFDLLRPANLALGRIGLSGRLGERVRQQLGLVYSVSSDLRSHSWGGEWVFAAGVPRGGVERARDAILAELRTLRADPLSASELADVKSYLIGSLPIRMETNDGIAATLLYLEEEGLGRDYLQSFEERVARPSAVEIHEAVQRWLDPDAVLSISAGPQ